MKKTIIAIMAVCAMMLTQCKKETANVTPGGLTGETVEVTVDASTVGDRTEITASGVVTWNEGDRLYVVGESSGYLGYLTAQRGGSSTVRFEGIINETATPQNYRFYYVGPNSSISGDSYTYNVSSQYGTLTGDNGIAKRYQLMKSEPKYIDGPTPTRFGTIDMYSMNAIAHLSFKKDGEAYTEGMTLKGSYSSATLNTRTGVLTPVAGDITLNNTGIDYYVSIIPSGLPQNLRFTSASGLEKKLYAVPVVANRIYNQSSAKVIDISGWLKGEFSTSLIDKVKFAKGNLQYLGNADGTGTWRFADNQWDFMGNGSTTGNVRFPGYTLYNYASSNNAGGGSLNGDDKASARDLFGWATSGWENNNYFYMPYNCSNKESLKYNFMCGYGYGPGDGLDFLFSLTVFVESDWFYHNSGIIQNAGTSTGKGRTIESFEWDYLLLTRTVNGGTGEGHSFQKTVLTLYDGSTVYGMIIVPDDFDGTPALTESTSWSAWSVLEDKGAVFLPAAGKRDGASVGSTGEGYYWSSSSGYVQSNAWGMYISSQNSSDSPSQYFTRHQGCSLRGIKDI